MNNFIDKIEYGIREALRNGVFCLYVTYKIKLKKKDIRRLIRFINDIKLDYIENGAVDCSEILFWPVGSCTWETQKLDRIDFSYDKGVLVITLEPIVQYYAYFSERGKVYRFADKAIYDRVINGELSQNEDLVIGVDIFPCYENDEEDDDDDESRYDDFIYSDHYDDEE